MRLRLDRFPYKIGYDCAGVVTEVGDAVTRLQVGDEVYVRLPEASRGQWNLARVLFLRHPAGSKIGLADMNRFLERICKMCRTICRIEASVAILRRGGVLTTGGYDCVASSEEV